MQNPQTIFKLVVQLDSYEPASELGTYATRELADKVALFMHENWDRADSYRPTFTDFRIQEVLVQTCVPEFHLWMASIDLATGEEQQVNRLTRPTETPLEPSWQNLADPSRYVRCPMAFVAGSGKTAEEALIAAWHNHEKAIALGAKEILAKCLELSEAAFKEAERLVLEAVPDEEGNPPLAAWAAQPEILAALAEAYWPPRTLTTP